MTIVFTTVLTGRRERGGGGREGGRDRQTDRQIDRDRDRQTDKDKETEADTLRLGETDTD